MKSSKVTKAFMVLFCLVQLLSFSTVARATLINNGDFSSGLNGWNDGSFTGSVTENGGQAILSSGDSFDPFAAVLTQGDDGSFLFDSPIMVASNVSMLSVDAALVSTLLDPTELGGSAFSDTLFLAIYDAADVTFDAAFEIPALGNVAETFLFDMSDWLGREIAISFELADEDDGFNRSYSVDNVFFTFNNTPVSVPEPESFIMFLVGLTLLARCRKSA
ncbi:PEP-CTERM sorting domain-containing protein [Alteromonas gracilis]|uniref:PEP-CTERM sorting domain-containing protein n=1 Tax=Alteromonas gracilis TaxID=1479524 RepID=UPI003736521D